MRKLKSRRGAMLIVVLGVLVVLALLATAFATLQTTERQIARNYVDLVRANHFDEDIYLRPIAYKSSERIGVHLSDDSDLLIAAVPFGKYLDDEKPLALGVSSWRRAEDNAIPSRAKVNGGVKRLLVCTRCIRSDRVQKAS